MKLPKFIILLVLITSVSLIYVQLQIEIFRQAYQGSLNESRLNDMLDDNSILMYNVYTLQSAQHVGDKLLAKEKNLQFAHRQQIAEVRIPFKVSQRVNIASQKVKKQPNFFARIFTLKSQAEAKQ